MCVSCGNGPAVRWKLAVRVRGDLTPLKLRNREEDIPAVPRAVGVEGPCRYSFLWDGDTPATGFSFHM